MSEIKCGMPLILLAGLYALLKEMPEEERKAIVEEWKKSFSKINKHLTGEKEKLDV